MSNVVPLFKEPVFDAYVMTDWSAASRPVQGANSIWISALARTKAGPKLLTPINPPTRFLAANHLVNLLAGLANTGKRVLAGFDFAIGYPEGTAAALGEEDWRGVWRRLHDCVEDDEDNTNNRFDVAADLNQQLSDGPWPFWGCPINRSGELLSQKKPSAPKDWSIAEHRLCDEAASGSQPVWKLYGHGSVGGQTLVGIPVLEKLKRAPELNGRIKVWPFDLPLAPLERDALLPGTIVVAETFPSAFPVQENAGEVKDAAQVRCVVEALAHADQSGKLGGWFDGMVGLTPEQRSRVSREEGWILGVGT